MINIQVNEPYEGQVNPALLERAAQAALLAQRAEENVELTIVIDGDEAIQELNSQYLGIHAPTDVLSFPADDLDPDSGNHYIGDIIISLPRARLQADTASHPVESELQLLVIHGVLHLLGMDHAEPQEKQAMWAAQQAILDGLGVKLSRLPED